MEVEEVMCFIVDCKFRTFYLFRREFKDQCRGACSRHAGWLVRLLDGP